MHHARSVFSPLAAHLPGDPHPCHALREGVRPGPQRGGQCEALLDEVLRGLRHPGAYGEQLRGAGERPCPGLFGATGSMPSEREQGRPAAVTTRSPPHLPLPLPSAGLHRRCAAACSCRCCPWPCTPPRSRTTSPCSATSTWTWSATRPAVPPASTPA